MRESFRSHIVLYLLAAGALAIVLIRACIQSMTIDEATSIVIYVGGVPAGMHWYPASGNHVLQSALAKVFASIFGINEVTARAPAILGAIVYIASAFYFCLLITARKFLRWLLFAFLVYNPLILDYLIAGRGYALAIGFQFAALCMLTKMVLGGGGDRLAFHARWASFFVGISFCSNFSFAYADAIIMAGFFLWASTTALRSQLGYLRLAECCFLPGILTAIAICGPTLWDFPRSQLYFGSTSLREMWHSVISATFDELNPDILNRWMMAALRMVRNKLPIASVVAFVAMWAFIEWQRVRSRKQNTDPRVTLLRLVSTMGLVAFLFHWIAFRAAQIPLPAARTALMLVLLWCVAFSTALAVRAESARFDPPGAFAAGVLILSVGYFAGCLRLGYFKEWQFDADTKQLYWLVNDLRTRCGIKKFGIDWRYSGALDFYRLAYGNFSIPNFDAEDSSNLPKDRDAYVIFLPTSQDFVKEQQLKVTYGNPETGAGVAIRGCEADSSAR